MTCVQGGEGKGGQFCGGAAWLGGEERGREGGKLGGCLCLSVASGQTSRVLLLLPLLLPVPTSTHTQGITTAIAYQHGMGSSAFALAVALSSIVMYDAAGVRRHAGEWVWGGGAGGLGGWHMWGEAWEAAVEAGTTCMCV